MLISRRLIHWRSFFSWDGLGNAKPRAIMKMLNTWILISDILNIRDIAKMPRRQIFYRAPCGRRLRDFAELHRFLLDTNFKLSIDHFSFDQNVDCLSEFQASRVLFSIKVLRIEMIVENQKWSWCLEHFVYFFLKQDISYGKEIKPVQAINSLDHDYPEYVEYSSERVPGSGVPLDLNPDYLVCCDCTDDCQARH